MRIAVIGAGGVGGYFGGRLAEAGADVSFVARGRHLAAMQATGLTIKSPAGDAHVRVKATSNPADIGPADVVLFTVKLYDTDAATALLPPLIGPQTAVIPLQNGVDGVDIVTRAVGAAHTAGGTCYVSAAITEPGVISHTAMETLIFGELDGSSSARLERFRDACAGAKFRATLSTNIIGDIWAKFARLSVMAGMTAVTRSALGVIVNDPELLAMLRAAVAEAEAVARAKGIALRADIVDDTERAYRALPAHTKASMLVDLEQGRRLELPWLSGAVARIGHEVGVPTPTHSFITTVLRPFVNGTAAAK